MRGATCASTKTAKVSMRVNSLPLIYDILHTQLFNPLARTSVLKMMTKKTLSAINVLQKV